MSPSGAARSLRTLPARSEDEYSYYRRPLGVRELLPAVGVGLAAGAMAFYLARILIQRTPFLPLERPIRLSPDDLQ